MLRLIETSNTNMKYPLIKPKYYISLFKEIASFIIKPAIGEKSEKSIKLKIYDIIGLFVLKFICLIPVILFFALVYDPENIQGVSMAKRFSPLVLLLIVGFILPFLEEVAFRLSLVFKPVYLAATLGVLTYYIMTKLVFHTKMSAIDDSFYLRLGVSILTMIVIYPIVSISAVKSRLAEFWSNNFRYIYYIICVVFAWLHISKYELNMTNILLLPILTMPQLMSALIYGYVRVKFGFQYPLLFHISNNVIAFSISTLIATDMIYY